jgi:hypothetical protein
MISSPNRGQRINLSLISLVMEISLAKKRKAVKDFVSLTAFL